MKRKLVTVTIQDEVDNGAEQPGTSGASTTKKRHRGPTKMKHVWKMPNNQRILIKANRYNQPVGPGALNLTNFCGVIARTATLCPLSHYDWRKVPTTTKNEATKTIKKYFSYPAVLDEWVKKSIGQKWKNYKSELKGKYYDADKSEEENVQVVPPKVTPQDWQFLVHFWKTTQSKKLEKTNKTSRAQQKMLHTTGSKSFAVLLDEMEQEKGEPVGVVDFYEPSHTRKDGTFLDGEVVETLARAKQLQEEKASTSQADPITVQLEVMAEVGGKVRNGRFPGLGLGPTRTQVFGSKSTSCRHDSCEISELKAKVDDLTNLVTALMEKISQTDQSTQQENVSAGSRVLSTEI